MIPQGKYSSFVAFSSSLATKIMAPKSLYFSSLMDYFSVQYENEMVIMMCVFMCLSSWECLGSDELRFWRGAAFLILYFWFLFFQWRSHTCKTQSLRLGTQTRVCPYFLSGRCCSEFLVPQGCSRSIPTPEPGTTYVYPYPYPVHASRVMVCKPWKLNPVSIFQEFLFLLYP